jgi:ABC-type branched-subunit amino acid transport system substrate-binding protein
MNVSAQDEPKKHVVTELDNYYSLSLKYNVSIADLKLANPGVINPKPGDVLIIPGKDWAQPEVEKGECAKNGKYKDETFHIALMIPLYLEQVADTMWKANLSANAVNELAPFRFIQFYQGFMLAADSLKQKGLHVEIHVYDVDQQTSKLNEILGRPEMKKMDMIVGPFYKGTFAIAAGFAFENHIPIINPLSSRDDILLGNPYVYKILPSFDAQAELVAKLVNRDFSDSKVMFYVANKYLYQAQVDQFVQALEKDNTTGKPRVTVVDYARDSIKGFQDHASLTKPNLVIIYAENEVLPAALLSKLNALKNDYQVSVIGLPEWERFTNIESSYLISLNAHVFMASYPDYDSENLKAFIIAYRSRYFDEPQNYAFSGFDAGYYFLSALMNYGKDFEGCITKLSIPLIQNQYHFVKKGDGGYDNMNWNVMQYFDYSLFKKSL